MVVKSLDGYNCSDPDRQKAIMNMAREIMQRCDRHHVGKITATQINAHLKGTEFKTFQNFIMRKNQAKFKDFDKDSDYNLDMNELISAVEGFFDSDMYGAQMKKKELHPEDGKPHWKYTGPAETWASNPQDGMRDEHQEHVQQYDEAHPERGNMSSRGLPRRTPRAGSNRNTPRNPSKGEASTNIGWQLKHRHWMQAKQIGFAVKSLAGAKKSAPPNFLETPNILSREQELQARAVFKKWDKNKDGGVNRTELADAMMSVINAIRGAQAKTAGHITIFSNLKQEKIAEFVDYIFELADYNEDQILSEEEFVKIYNTIAINCINFDEDIIDQMM